MSLTKDGMSFFFLIERLKLTFYAHGQHHVCLLQTNKPNKTLGDFCNLKHLLKSQLHAQFNNKVLREIKDIHNSSCLEVKGMSKIV